MKRSRLLPLLAALTVLVSAASASAATGVQIGASGKTYASSALACALHPVYGMSPLVRAGLYNAKKSSSATVLLNDAPVGLVTFFNPDADVWLVNGVNTVAVSLSRRVVDSYVFDATSTQVNVCIPDTSGNVVSGGLEYAASGTSYATVTPGCAWNPLTNAAQPYVMLIDTGALLNVSLNGVALTQLNPTTRPRATLFLAPGLNVVTSASAGGAFVDFYVRDGGTGTCTLP